MSYSDYAEYYEYILDSAEANQAASSNDTSLNHPLFRFESPLDNVVGLKIVEAVIPITYYVLQSGKNVFGANLSDFEYITVPPGTYSASSLAATIKSLLETTYPGSLWTITFNSNTGKFTFSVTISSVPQYFALQFADPGINELLGFNIGTTGAVLSATSDVLAKVTGPNYLYICSDQIGSYMNLHLPSVDLANKGGLGPEMAMIPINVNFMDVMYWKDHSSEFVFYTPGINSLQSLDLYLTLGKELPVIDLNGLSFQVKLGILKRKDSQNAQMLGVKRMRAI